MATALFVEILVNPEEYEVLSGADVCTKFLKCSRVPYGQYAFVANPIWPREAMLQNTEQTEAYLAEFGGQGVEEDEQDVKVEVEELERNTLQNGFLPVTSATASKKMAKSGLVYHPPFGGKKPPTMGVKRKADLSLNELIDDFHTRAPPASAKKPKKAVSTAKPAKEKKPRKPRKTKAQKALEDAQDNKETLDDAKVFLQKQADIAARNMEEKKG